MKPEPETIPDSTQPFNLFRRSATWLKKSGIAHTGKKAKRLLHRKDRHESRHQLRTLSF